MLQSTNYESLLETSSSLKSSHKITMEWNYNNFNRITKSGCYKTVTAGAYQTAYQENNSSGYYDNGISKTIFKNTGTDIVQDDKNREKYTPLLSVFEPNRPDPGILHLTAYRKGTELVDPDILKVSNFGNIAYGTRTERVYPIYKNSLFKYWNSVRQIDNGSVVGLSSADNSIQYASVFAIYEDTMKVNKIVIKTQKYSGYPKTFKVEILNAAGNTWTPIYSGTNMTTGILELYYNNSVWSTTKSELSTFISPASTQVITTKGIRFSVTEMSDINIPLELIEISPRLICDVSDYVMSFDKKTQLSQNSVGLPISGVSTTTSTLKLSNVDRIFSSRNPDSILSNFLVKNVETKYYQIMTKTGVATETIPLGTFYTDSWTENTDYSTDINLEDYFLILKSIKAPDISIANISGIEASVALLILLDNCGITNYSFERLSSTSLDDFVIEYFFSNKDQTVLNAIEDIALSGQIAIYMDANNIITAVTKEKLLEKVSPANTDIWMIGSEEYAGKTEETWISGKLANILDISESKVLPITDATIEYKGNGIQRQPLAVIKTPELFSDPNNIPFYNASIISRNLSYVNTELWSVDSEQSGSDKVLLSMPYIQSISSTRPSIINTAIAGTSAGQNNSLKAASENDLIRTIYSNASTDDRKYFEIVLDPERGTEFMKSNKFFGHVILDSELIKYKGMVVDVFDQKDQSKTKRSKVIFSENELSSLVGQTSSGSSVICRSILVDLIYKVKDITTSISNNEKEYEFISDGRGQENSSVVEHTAQTDISLLPFRVKLLDTTTPITISPIGTMVSKSINKLNPLNPKSTDMSISYPGYFKVSGPTSVFSKEQLPDLPASVAKSVTEKYIPIDNLGERFITGFYKELNFTPQRISTRMRLLSKPPTALFTGTTTGVKDYFVLNRGIGGIGFNLSFDKVGADIVGTTGYFVEIEDVGNITAEQLEKTKFKNLRFYKIQKQTVAGASRYVPKILKSAWVNVSAVAGESIDFGQSVMNEGSSYAGTSDISVVQYEEGSNKVYKIYWEGQLVCSYKEPLTSATSTNNIGLICRSDSVAMFDYLLACKLADNKNYNVPLFFNSKEMTVEELAERGYISTSVADASTGNSDLRVYMEDFGKQLREAKKFDVRFPAPSVSANLITLSKLNKDYSVKNFSFSSYGAEFWVFNTSRSSIPLSLDSNTPVIISGIQINSVNPGEVSLKKYVSEIMGEDNTAASKFEQNIKKYGENSYSFGATYLNSYNQAMSLIKWLLENANEEKREFDIGMFANPLLEIGDKVRIFYPEIELEMDKIIDKVYYINSISYSVGQDGPSMSIGIREI